MSRLFFVNYVILYIHCCTTVYKLQHNSYKVLLLGFFKHSLIPFILHTTENKHPSRANINLFWSKTIIPLFELFTLSTSHILDIWVWGIYQGKQIPQTCMMMMTTDVLWPLLCIRQAKWDERPPNVMKQSKMKHPSDMPMLRFELRWQ